MSSRRFDEVEEPAIALAGLSRRGERVERLGHSRRVGVQVERRAVRRRTTAIAGRAGSGRARRRGRGPPRRRSAAGPTASAGWSAPCRTGTHPPRAPRPCRPASGSSRTGRPHSPAPPACRRGQPAKPAADHTDPARPRMSSSRLDPSFL